jgi:heme a synthase
MRRHRLVTLEEVQDRLRPVRRWLWWVAVLLIAIVLVGGLTRLTGSGLSITEWRPISGVLPPLSEIEWQAEFERYRAIPQFLAVNTDMTLAEFKIIYGWEWTHRLLARAVGVVFLLPFLFFLWRGLINRALGWKLAGIFALGGLQGAIGWWMVQSGLAERTDVSQYRLAVHLTLACAILAATVATAESLQPWRRMPAMPRQRRMAGILLLLVFLQFLLGALVAKTGAGLIFNTWPLMDGRFLPPADALFAMQPPWKNFFENVLTIQFDHRIAAYLLFFLSALHAIDVQRAAPAMALRAAVLFALITLQAMLGVLTLLYDVPLWLALGHQVGAIVVLVVATVHVAQMRA